MGRLAAAPALRYDVIQARISSLLAQGKFVAPPTQTALSEGMLFHDRYQIVRCLAAGGMGAVYECVHLTTQKHRALKVMLPQVLAARGMRERFELEARVTAAIDSEHIVETFDAGVDMATGSPFLVMEFLKGEDLENILREHGPFTPQETVVLLSQAALALDKTHAAGIVHRDLKPQNLFLTTRDDGSPRLKILDFGIAKVVADGTKTAQQTAAIGTPIYMSPEQTTGDGTIGPPADLYALGHIAFSLLVGEAYWMEEMAALPVYALLSRMLAGPTEAATARAGRRGVTLPAAFDAWFLRATARMAPDRFDCASTQIAELATVLGTPAPRQLLNAPPPLTQRLSVRGSVVPSQPPQEAAEAVSQPSAQAPSQPPSASPSTGASAAPRVTTGGTMGPLANDPIPAPPVASRTPMLVLAVLGAVAAAAGVFAVVRAVQSPSGGQASAATASAAPTLAGATQPPLAVTQAVAVAPAPTVEPASPSSGSPSPSAAAAADHPKKVGAPATPPLPPPPPPPPTKVTATAAPKAAPNCNPPFTVDAAGAKHAKPECL
jgi:serine/threonine-protein kinase